MSSTNNTTHYELSQYIGTDKPTYLGDYNSDMLAIDNAIYSAASDASTALTTANSAASTASDAATAASSATTTANTAKTTADSAAETAATASTNAAAALTAAQGAQTAAAANTITNLAPAYDPTLTYAVDDLVTYIDVQGSGKLYKCIVAVESPEAFNINKWDDVTTSEAFEHAKNTVPDITFEGDGVTTYKTLMNSVYSQIDFTKITTNTRMISRNSNGDVRFYHSDFFNSTNGYLKFSVIDPSTSNLAATSFTFRETGSSYIRITIDNTPTVTITNNSDNPSNADISYEIYY